MSGNKNNKIHGSQKAHEPAEQPLNVFGPIDEPVEEISQIDALPKPEKEEMALDDARRVKVLSPGMLVFKRFIRNKLAVVGLIILAFMFTFSFLGPLFVPYTQTQVFKGVGTMSKEYAGAIFNTEERYTVAEGEEFTPADRAAYLYAKGKGQTHFTSGNTGFYYVEVLEGFNRIVKLAEFAKTDPMGNLHEGDNVTEAFKAAYDKASKQDSFEFEGTRYIITGKKEKSISTEKEVAIASLQVFDAVNPSDLDVVQSHAFKLTAAEAVAGGTLTFEFGDETYKFEKDGDDAIIYTSDGKEFAAMSKIIVNPLDSSNFLSVDFKKTVRETMNNRLREFSFKDPNGEEIHYRIVVVNQNYNIMRDQPTSLVRIYEFPSPEHPLGLDNNGMDLLTRLMYGGRISLMVGFVVVIIEMLIGVVIGGISGYFGGVVDTALMRFVDLFNSIPFYPIVIIFGSVMDALQVGPTQRIFLLMAILGILGWTGIARVVRGQILSLREQDFMVATEATGIRTSRRIFRHLIPNVMPLLIVSATASLGGIIISEATLGFLGLGIKYPQASWGSIINIASEAHVMQTYWFMWFPAGMLILLTVLGFNFVGDGLRDAYDPKMKR